MDVKYFARCFKKSIPPAISYCGGGGRILSFVEAVQGTLEGGVIFVYQKEVGKQKHLFFSQYQIVQPAVSLLGNGWFCLSLTPQQFTNNNKIDRELVMQRYRDFCDGVMYECVESLFQFVQLCKKEHV